MALSEESNILIKFHFYVQDIYYKLVQGDPTGLAFVDIEAQFPSHLGILKIQLFI